MGAAVTARQLRESPVFKELFPDLHDFLALFASTQIRSRATVGGNIINASPIGDLTILFLALGAILNLSGRSVPLNEFYLGYKELDKKPGELLTEVSFPVPEQGSVLSALKVSKRQYLDIASVNSAMLFRIGDGVVLDSRISAGGVAPIPLLLERTGEYLKGKPVTDETINGACETALHEISPIRDIRGSREYKTELLKAQIRAHLTRRAGI